MDGMEKDLEQQLRFSEQKRMQMRARLAQDLSGDNTFVWSVVDLMTLLLIFFIFLYSQHDASLFSNSTSSVRMAVVTKPSLQQTVSPKTTPPKPEMAGDSKRNLKTPAMDLFDRSERAEPNVASKAVSKTEDGVVNESMAQLKEEALAAIKGNNQETFSIRWNDHRLIFVLGERVTFPVGRAKLLPESSPFLEKISHVIASKKDFDILVSGHTDDTPIDTYQFPSNWELSAARAISVARFLIQNGVDSRRLSIQGYAEYRPMYPNSTPQNKQANRRVEITLVKQKPLETEHSYDPNPVK